MDEPSINLKTVLLLLGAAQGVFLALVLARMKTGNRTANRFLSLLLAVFSAGLVEGFLSVTYYYLRYPYLIGLQWPLMFAYGPLGYFYAKALTTPRWKIRRGKVLIHFIPVLLVYLYLVPFFFLDMKTKARLWYLQNSHFRNDSTIIDPLTIVAIVQIGGYLILSLRLLAMHSRNIRQNFSSLENVSLSWLRTLIIVFIFLLSLYTFFAVFSQFYGMYEKASYLNNLVVAIVIYVMGYKGIGQAEIFTASASLDAVDETQKSDTASTPDEMTLRQQAHAGTEENAKYAKSSLSDQQADAILLKLTRLMEREKPHLEMGLTLPMLAKMLDVSPNHLSQVINGKLNKSFFDFVNSYRVEEAKRVLTAPESDRFSILGIAMDAGFNSKSSFYSAFKKHTGMTPSQFKEGPVSRERSEP